MPFAQEPYAPSPGVRAAIERVAAVDHRSPVLVVDLAVVRRLLARLRAALPGVRLLYAAKACDHPSVLRQFAAAGTGFDVASAYEAEAALRVGAFPSDLSYGNPVKPRQQIAAAYALGVRRFVADSPHEIDKLAEAAPGAQVLFRVTVDQTGADWPLAGKYGVSPGAVPRLADRARSRGLVAEGLVFHAGSQQRRPQAFADAARRCAGPMRRSGLRTLNLGGGWPACVRVGDPVLEPAAAAALDAVRDLPGVRLEAEPGRALVAAAGTVVTRVIGVARRDGHKWAYLDAGLYGGLLEADGEITRYALWTDADGPPTPTVLAGPTCDSTDVLYRRSPPLLPAGLREGHRVLLGGAGAYTTAYCTVGFNGLPPLRAAVVDEDVLEAELLRVDRPVVQPA